MLTADVIDAVRRRLMSAGPRVSIQRVKLAQAFDGRTGIYYYYIYGKFAFSYYRNTMVHILV